MDNQTLKHYGILGMRWGVRRSDAQLARSRGSSKRSEPHEDYTKAHSKKSVKSMSNAELRERNNRLQMERQYKDLTKKETSKGRKFVGKVLGAAATTVATTYAVKYMQKGVDALLKK